jgi:hypothetical protein
MIEHVWTVLCRDSVIDRDSNNLSLFNVLEQITVHSEMEGDEAAVAPIEMEAVSLWSRSDDDVPAKGVQRLTLLSPSGETLASGEQEIDLSKHRRFRNRVRFGGLPVKGAGRYIFRVEQKNEGEAEWQHVTGVPLELTFEAEA